MKNDSQTTLAQLVRSLTETKGRFANSPAATCLFVGCSDFAYMPNRLVPPSDRILEIQNIGNMVPPFFQAAPDSNGCSFENILIDRRPSHIVVIGHTGCGVVESLFEPGKLDGLPHVSAWLEIASSARRLANVNSSMPERATLIEAAVHVNVITQLDHLMTYPAIATAVSEHRLKLHGWVHQASSAEVKVYDQVAGIFRAV